MKKRILSVLLSGLMLAGMLPSAFAASDIEGHWAKSYIEYLHAEQVYFPSATDGTYKPDQKMTRAEFMRYVNRAFHFTETAAVSYTDVNSNAWYYETVQIAEKYGYITGVGDNKMNPLGEITREQAAVILGRLFKEDADGISPSELSFTDKSQIGSWSAGYIKAAADQGILTGYSDGSFKPRQTVTRGEVAKVLYFYLGTSLSTAGKAYYGTDLKSDTDNVTISESCTLSDANIRGDLYLTEGLGSSAVTLNNVTVNGSIIVSGGTVNMVNTTSDHMVISSAMGRLVQTTATGATHIGQTDVRTSASLYENGLTTAGREGFVNVSVQGSSRVPLTLDASVSALTAESEATISTTAGAAIHLLTAEQPVTITGYGSIYQADLQCSGCSIAEGITISGYTLPDGVTAEIAGQTASSSSEAGISPTAIAFDLADLSSLGAGVQITLPTGKTVNSVTCDSVILSPSTGYTTNSTGVMILTSYLSSLPRGSHTITISMADGKRAVIGVTVSNTSATADATALSFDRYYNAAGFADVQIKLADVIAASEIDEVVLGLSKLEYSFAADSRVLTLRRGLLAPLPAGVYTVTVKLTNGTSQLAELTVTDSTPTDVTAIVAEYDTFNPIEAFFAIELSGRTVKSLTAVKNNAVQTLVSGTDFKTETHGITLTKTGLEKLRVSGTCVAFTATLSDNAQIFLVVDYL